MALEYPVNMEILIDHDWFHDIHRTIIAQTEMPRSNMNIPLK